MQLAVRAKSSIRHLFALIWKNETCSNDIRINYNQCMVSSWTRGVKELWKFQSKLVLTEHRLSKQQIFFSNSGRATLIRCLTLLILPTCGHFQWLANWIIHCVSWNKEIDLNMKLDTIFIGVAFIVCQQLSASIALRNADTALQRNKRFAFLKNSGMGVS